MKFLKEMKMNKNEKKKENRFHNSIYVHNYTVTYRSILVSEDATAQDLCRVINLSTPLCVSE